MGQNSVLQIFENEGFAGTFLLHHPVSDKENYMKRDKAFRDACCEIGSNEYCQKFFERRRINMGKNYKAPALGKYFILCLY